MIIYLKPVLVLSKENYWAVKKVLVANQSNGTNWLPNTHTPTLTHSHTHTYAHTLSQTKLHIHPYNKARCFLHYRSN